MNRVEKFLTELIGIAKDLSPEAEISTSTVSLEGEDATLRVVVPGEKFDEVDEQLHRRSYDILLDEGYHIVVLVYDREELASRMAA